jgi:hypothetical protein
LFIASSPGDRRNGAIENVDASRKKAGGDENAMRSRAVSGGVVRDQEVEIAIARRVGLRRPQPTLGAVARNTCKARLSIGSHS